MDVLRAQRGGPLVGKRVGLLTNNTGLTGRRESTIDVLNTLPGVKLVALFGPEHGIRGTARPGEKVESGKDEKTGLPVYSLYGATEKPTPAMLKGLDAFVVDLQDVGTRYYTYDWTTMLAMTAAAEARLDFYILDRPDPIGALRTQGNVLDPKFATIVGAYPVPMAFAMTLGELATYVNQEFHVGARLHVIRMTGWKHGLWFDMTNLPWTPPSPNMPDLQSAAFYPGTCLFEGTNVSVGRGTPHAFAQIGAPWLDGSELARRLNARKLPGVRFEATSFTPRNPGDDMYPDTLVHGVRFIVANRSTLDAGVAGVAAAIEIQAMAPDKFKFTQAAHFDRLAGTDQVRKQILAGATLQAITKEWPAQRAAFETIRRKYMLYR
ncbi:MAG TPA: DUF1343 domain-containing protein [Longimicrobiales bacterium]